MSMINTIKKIYKVVFNKPKNVEVIKLKNKEIKKNPSSCVVSISEEARKIMENFDKKKPF